MNQVETVIVGGGQAGLATSYFLTQQGRDHIVLEQAAYPAPVWRDERWDSFTLVTPNWASRLPGADLNGIDLDGFMPRQEIIATFDRYVAQFRLPVQCDTRVTAVEPQDGGGYRVRTDTGTLTARNVVIATGFFQTPMLPVWSADISPGVTQLHSSQYRNPESLPPGAVLVIGSAQSGCQIVEELYQRGRTVFLATGTAGRAPRRYRGKDVIAWLDQVGMFDLTPEQLPPGMSKFGGIPHFSGTNGGHTLNLHQFARDGVTLLGHLRGAAGNTLTVAPDLHANLTSADTFEREATDAIDAYIESQGLDAPVEELPQLHDGFEQPIIEDLDLRASGVSTIIWGIGYSFDYGLVKLPVTDRDGFPIQTNGVSSYPGLSFVGMPWMPTERPGFLIGVGDAAERIATRIVETSRLPVRSGGVPLATVPVD